MKKELYFEHLLKKTFVLVFGTSFTFTFLTNSLNIPLALSLILCLALFMDSLCIFGIDINIKIYHNTNILMYYNTNIIMYYNTNITMYYCFLDWYEGGVCRLVFISGYPDSLATDPA